MFEDSGNRIKKKKKKGKKIKKDYL